MPRPKNTYNQHIVIHFPGDDLLGSYEALGRDLNKEIVLGAVTTTKFAKKKLNNVHKERTVRRLFDYLKYGKIDSLTHVAFQACKNLADAGELKNLDDDVLVFIKSYRG